jgi:transcriptional regulator with XRE-family HTH domain
LHVANDSSKRLLARIKELRERLGLTQEAFAEKAGLTYKYYQHVEAGRKRDIRFSTLEKLAKACGMELWKMLQLDGESLALNEDRPNEAEAKPVRRRRK